MSRSWQVRSLFYVWCLVVCPVAGWFIAVFGTRGEGGITTFVLLFMGAAALAFAGAFALGRRWLETIAGVILAAGLGLLTWFLTLLWLAAHGFFDS